MIGFVVWNPFQVFHMRPVLDHLDDDGLFIVLQRRGLESLQHDFGGSVSAFVNRPHQIVTPKGLVQLDGQVEALACPNPFAGMNALASTRRIGIQYSMAKEEYQYGAWRSQFDVNLTYGDYSARRLIKYAPAIPVGNPRFSPWFNSTQDKSDDTQVSDRPTLLYLPTWGEFSSAPTFMPILERLSEEFEVIVKLHHKSYLAEPDTATAVAKSTLSNSLGARDDMIPLLRRADIVLSDYSGAIFDAIYVRKPVILLQSDPASLLGAKFSFDSAEYALRRSIGPVVTRPEELRKTIEQVLDGSLDYRDQNEVLRSDFFAEDSDAAARSAEVIRHIGVDRRNPNSPMIRRTTAVVKRNQATTRHEGADSVSRSKPSLALVRAAGRRAAVSTVRKARGATLLRHLAPLGRSRSSLLSALAIRLDGSAFGAISHLADIQRRGDLTVSGHLLLADLLFSVGRSSEAVATLAMIPDDSEADPTLLTVLAKAYRAISGPGARWNSLDGLHVVPRSTAVPIRSIPNHKPDVTRTLRLVLGNAGSIASDSGMFAEAATLYSAALTLDDDWRKGYLLLSKAREQAHDLDGAVEALESALWRGPFDRTAQSSRSRLGSKMEDWEASRAAALRCGSASSQLRKRPTRMTRFLTGLHVVDAAFKDARVFDEPRFSTALVACRDMAGARPREYWMGLHWRAICANRFTIASAIKDIVALSCLGDYSTSQQTSIQTSAVLANALTTLDRVEEARELLEMRLADAGKEPSRTVLVKQLADLSFFEGDLEAVAAWNDVDGSPRLRQNAAHDRARELIKGKHVVILGPSEVRSENHVTDQYPEHDSDLIVRTNLSSSRTPDDDGMPATDIVYFNSGITRLGIENLLRTSREQGVKQVVLRRPHMFNKVWPSIQAGQVRQVDSEPSCHLYSSSFAIQRIIYDLAMYRPAKISVKNVDFFTGAEEYAPGYKVPNADVSFRGFTHDFRSDFKLSQNLARANSVSFDPASKRLLDLSASDYLSLLDSKFSAN